MTNDFTAPAGLQEMVDGLCERASLERRPTIQIYPSAEGRCWVTRWPEDSEVAQVMGTRDVYTPFTLLATRGEVLATIRERNPEYRVIVIEPPEDA